MTNRTVPVGWMGAAVAVALALATGVLVYYGTGEKAVRTALDVTARWSFLLFWMAYCAGPLGTLFRPALPNLSRRGRDFGLAFAAGHLVHVGLIIRLGIILGRVPLHGGLLIFFAVALGFTYLLAAMSFGPTMNPLLWRAVMFLGLNYILVAFGRDFVLGAIKTSTTHRELWRVLDYTFFAGLCVAAPLIRLAASMRRR